MPTPRDALLAGATGLVGRALLGELLKSEHYRGVHVLVRRTPQDIAPTEKLKIHPVDFARLPTALPPVDDVFIALGTTIKAAGSEAAFRQVDFDFVVSVARAARITGARRLAVVSAIGADAKSRLFYSRVKGEMEGAITQLGYESVVIARPSWLAGDRAALGQPARPAEIWAARLLGPLGGILPKGMRPITARAVASALVTAMLDAKPGVHVLKSGAMQPRS
ncbi:MAG: NAD(P)H-binding protein [Burkholderiales bacterium]|nr:NAD(P)H-binding protein [Burkholderiales bacterium]